MEILVKKRRLIPFKMTPASWGLSGKAFDEAEINYYYEGEALERKLVELRLPSGTEREKRMLSIDLAYRKITQYDYDCRMLEINGLGTDTLAILENEYKHGRTTDTEYLEAKIRETMKGRDRDIALIELRLSQGILTPYEAAREKIELTEEGRAKALALLDLDLGENKITKRQHEKETATVKEEPWVGVIDDGFDVNAGMGLYLELDWNKQMIDYLMVNGYTGTKEEQVIEAWFADVCRTYVTESQLNEPFEPFRNRFVR